MSNVSWRSCLESSLNYEPKRERDQVAMSENLVLDCLGALCPTPIIQLSKAVRTMNPGDHITLKADDPATKSDLIAWARMTGNHVRVISETSFDIEKS